MIILDFFDRPRGAEVPLLTDDFLPGLSAVRRPAQGELLCPLPVVVFKNQPDPFQPKRLIENEPEGLLAGLGGTTVSTLALIPGTSLPGWGLTKTTALDEVRLVKRFAYPDSLLADAGRRYGLDLMEHVENDQYWGVSAGVAQGTTVALKNGWLPLAGAGWQVNSIGWISGHGRDYVLAVLSDRNPSYA